jgi:hypothetical protein
MSEFFAVTGRDDSLTGGEVSGPEWRSLRREEEEGPGWVTR